MIAFIAQPQYPLNSHVLAIFIPSATISTMPRYPELTERYSPQYDRLTFSLHFMTNTPFLNFLPPFPPPFSITWPVQSHHPLPH